jgi:hypothetical protein
MKLKPLYRAENIILIGLKSDFEELCVIDGLVIEVDMVGKTLVGEPISGLQKLKTRDFTPIRQHEKREYTRMIEKKLKKKLIKRIEEKLVEPPQESIRTLSWIPDRLEP